MDVDIGNIDVPMLVRSQRLNESCALLAGTLVPFLQPPCLAEHTPHAGRANSNNVGIDHHVCQPPIPFQWVQRLKLQNLFLLPILYPEIPGNPSVVPVDLAVALSPVVKLPDRQLKLLQHALDGHPGLCRPAPHEVHYLVALVRLNPFTVQSSPSAFFNARSSAINSARTSSFCRILLSSFTTRS